MATNCTRRTYHGHVHTPTGILREKSGQHQRIKKDYMDKNQLRSTIKACKRVQIIHLLGTLVLPLMYIHRKQFNLSVIGSVDDVSVSMLYWNMEDEKDTNFEIAIFVRKMDVWFEMWVWSLMSECKWTLTPCGITYSNYCVNINIVMIQLVIVCVRLILL